MYDENIMQPSALIRHLRAGAGLTQHALARRIGTDQAAVSRWERGHDEPRLRTLHAIASACGRRLELQVVDDGVDRAQLRQNLLLRPAERLATVANVGSLRSRARRI